MAEIFKYQFDYIYFFYGLSFMIVAQACLSLSRPARGRLPWIWLGLFGIVHGANEWLDLLAISVGTNRSFDVLRVVVLVVSFFFIAVFGRAGTAALRGGRPGRWLLFVLVFLSLSGFPQGAPGLSAAARYTLGLVGGLLAAYALYRASRDKEDESGGWLLPGAAAFGLYALATGLVVPPAAFFPADTVNYDTFADAFGFPVQLARGIFALTAAVSITGYSWSTHRRQTQKTGFGEKSPTSVWAMTLIIGILAAGWVITQTLGGQATSEAKENLLSRTMTIAASIDAQDVADLSGSAEDAGKPAFVRLREHLKSVSAANPDIRFVYLMGLKKIDDAEREIFLVDAEPGGSPDYSTPGSVYWEAEPGDIEDLKAGKTTVYDEYEDAWGTWVTGVAPVLKPGSQEVIAQVGLDVDAAQWQSGIKRQRLIGIMITLTLCVTTISFFLVWQRSKESALQREALRIASVRLADQKMLRDTTSALGEGLFVTDDRARLTLMNPEAERLLGYREAELIGTDVHRTIHFQKPDGSAKAREDCVVHKTLATGEMHREEEDVFTKKDGAAFPVSIVTNPITEGGRVVGAVSAFQDITKRKKAEKLLRESEEKYKNLVELTSDIIYISDREGREVYMNDAGFGLLEMPPDEVIGQPWSKFIHPEDVERSIAKFREMVEEGMDVFNFENRLVSKSGRVINVLHNVRVMRDGAGNVTGTQGIARDITNRKLAEEALKESEEKFRGLAEKSPNMIFINKAGRVVYANETAENTMGYTRDEMYARGFDFRRLVAPDSHELVGKAFEKHTRGEDVEPYEYTLISRAGRRISAINTTRLIRYEGETAILGIVTDITERKRAEEAIQKSLKEKEVLLREIHHRVKNNLQVIYSLLKLQSRYAKDEHVKDIFRESRNRIKSMAFVHERLYLSKDLAAVDFDRYVGDLTRDLFRSYGADRGDISLRVDTGGVTLGLDHAIPCGLIINELVSNSLKHAFPDGGPGEIRISLGRARDGGYELAVGDDGVGMPPEMGPDESGELGLHLVKILAEDQLGGELALERSGGTRFTIRFKGV